MPRKKTGKKTAAAYKKIGQALWKGAKRGMRDEEEEKPRRRRRPSPRALGTGMARRAGERLRGRRRQLEEQERGILSGGRR